MTLKRFETAPGHQSQIDWGQARVYFGGRGVTVHLFVLTLGYSRRSFYRAYPNEQLGAFLEAHEGAFEHFGGYLPIDRAGANLFFQLISRRYEKGPMILTSNRSFGAWGEVFGDRIIATAILDRVLHHTG